MATQRILLVFADGLGLAPAGPGNPLSRLPSPALDELLGGPLTLERVQARDGLLLAALDATLGVPGLPQSATGQTALFTGENAAALLGRHVTALPGPALRTLLEERSLLKRVVEAAGHATFANAYTDAFIEEFTSGRRRPSATTCCVLGAGLPFRRLPELLDGRAVTWDVCRDRFAERTGIALEPVTATQAGHRLAELAGVYDLTLYETFLTDLAGHGRRGVTAEEAIVRLDGLLAGALAAKTPDTTLLLASDHGNLEDATTASHTRNPVPLLAVGPAARRFAGAESILDLVPRILAVLGAGQRSGSRGVLAPTARPPR
jgi:hypothetical protein